MSIPINLQSIKDTLGMRSGHIPVVIDEELGKATFLALFGLDEVPSIKFFGDKIMNEALEDDDFCHCFMSVSLGCFLCPNSNTKLSTKYMGALVQVDKIKDLNWPKFVHDWLIWYIKKYLAEKKKHKRLTITLGGCLIPRKRRRSEDHYQTHNSAEAIGNHSYNSNVMLNKMSILDDSTTKMDESEKIEPTQINEKLSGQQADVGFTMPIRTASLDNMIHEDDHEDAKSNFGLENLAQSHMLCTDGKSKYDTEGIEHFGSLRINKDESNKEFIGFSNVEDEKKEMKLHQTNDINMQYREGGSKTMSRDIDINLPNITIIAKHYANLQLNPARQKKRSEIIEDARKKYFFYDDATPSFRLLEYEDDTGKQIEEPDLWRPSDMDDETYRKKIEEAKFLADQDGQKKGVEMASIKTPEKQCSEHSKMNEIHICCKDRNISILFEINGADYSSSVQCAQRQPSCTDLTESPIQERQKKQNDLFVDLVTPEATKKFYMKSRIEDTSDNKRNDYTKAILVGRNLFPNDVDDESVEIENVSSSNRNFLQRANVLSELEIFGERNFKDTCNIMCNEADNMYNTKLCLGSSNSSASKENFIPRRVLNASRYICSPYDINQMIIKPSEIKYYEAITTLCDIDESNTNGQ